MGGADAGGGQGTVAEAGDGVPGGQGSRFRVGGSVASIR